MPNANSITGILPFVSEICIWDFVNESPSPPPNTKTADSVSVEGKIFLLSRLFLSQCRGWSKAVPSQDPFFHARYEETAGTIDVELWKICHFFVIAWGCIQFCFQRDCLTHPRRQQKSILTLFTFTVVSWSFSSPLPCRSIRTDPGFDARLTRPPTHKHARVLADQSAAASRRAFSHCECETTPPKIRSVSASTVCSLSGSTNAGASSGKK